MDFFFLYLATANSPSPFFDVVFKIRTRENDKERDEIPGNNGAQDDAQRGNLTRGLFVRFVLVGFSKRVREWNDFQLSTYNKFSNRKWRKFKRCSAAVNALEKYHYSSEIFAA